MKANGLILYLTRYIMIYFKSPIASSGITHLMFKNNYSSKSEFGLYS